VSSWLARGAGLLALVAAPLASAVEVDIEKLTSVDWQQGKELPKEIRDLDGKEVVISGYMQSDLKKDSDTILIVGNSCQCTGTPLPQHFVRVKLDKETGYRPGQLTFIGTLSVGEELEDGFVTSLYRLEGRFF
jgi:hypothetical protein